MLCADIQYGGTVVAEIKKKLEQRKIFSDFTTILPQLPH